MTLRDIAAARTGVCRRHFGTGARYKENKWAAAKGHLDETTCLAAEPVIEKYKT